MRVDLLLVLGLQNQDNLDWHEVIGVLANRQDQLRGGIDGKLCGILRMRVNIGCGDDVWFSLPQRYEQRYPFRRLAFS